MCHPGGTAPDQDAKKIGGVPAVNDMQTMVASPSKLI